MSGFIPAFFKAAAFDYRLLSPTGRLLPLVFKKAFLNWATLSKIGILKPIYFKQSNFATNVTYGGNGTVTGLVEIGTLAVQRKVRLYESSTGLLIREQWSNSDGTYSFPGLRKDIAYTVSATDDLGNYNDVIAARVTAL